MNLLSHIRRLPLIFAGLLLVGLLLPRPAAAQLFCVYDPLGAGGDYFSLFKDYQLAAKRWGVDIELKVYTDDAQLDTAFRAGQCDMASMIGMRARAFNMFTGTVDAPGVIENWVQLHDVMNVMASPQLARFMVSGNTEVVGMIPIGPDYMVTSNRAINSLETAKGKKVAIMAWDKTQPMMAEYFHVIPVPTDIPHYATLFNDGKVDFLTVPMALYKPLELNKGVGTQGGIVRRPLFQFTMQLVAYPDKFPPGFGQKSREFMATEADHAISLARNLESQIDSRLWVYTVHAEITAWDSGMRAALEKMTKAGYFDRRMLALIKRVRCKTDVDEPECAPSAEQTQNASHP